MKKILIGLSFALFGLQSCDVLDVDPQSFYSENVAYASIENVDFYVKDLYQAFHEYSDIEKPVDVYDDGFSDLLKYATKIYQDMMVLFYHARYSYILFSKMLFPSRRLEKHCCRRFLSMFFCFHLFSCE